MSHLMESTRRMAENDPTIEKYPAVTVGNWVVYHGRVGSMRQGRTEFPGLVLRQHPDDGSLDLIVFFEAEDIIWEQRVRPKSLQQPGHCWTHVQPIEGELTMDQIAALIRELKQQMYGDYEAPNKSMIEYLDRFDQRIKKLEKLLAQLDGAR